MTVPMETARPAGKRTFRLLRHFSLLSAVALALVIAALVILYRHFAVGGIILLAERQNELLTRTVFHAIWPPYGAHLASAGRLDAVALRNRPETGEIHRSLQELARHLPILKVKIYDLKGRVVFSTEAREIGQGEEANVLRFLSSGAEKPLTILGWKERFNGISGTAVRRFIAESYIPVRWEKKSAEAVFETYADVTGLMAEVNSNAGYFFFGLFLSFGALYGCLLLVVRRAEGILNSQHDEILKERSRLAASLDEIQRTQKMLVRAEKLSSIGTLTAGASHEILNPANIIGLHAQRLQWEHGEDTPVRESAGVILRNVKRITRICDNLRRFSSDEKLAMEPFSPEEVLSQCVKRLEPELRLAGVEIARDLLEPPARAVGDENQIQHVFLNLLRNAMDAMPEGGTLTVSSRKVSEDGGKWWELRVADTGAGIPADILHLIFDPFFTTKPEGKGMGLGLSVSHGIVEAHGGKIWAESAPREGAAFVIRLPLEAAQPPP
ncbi:MAG: HAMP domain-containing histidine kinase [Candidatus Tectomicrobia bacterium]|uniref:histidine kinase n=1 Tax=Tectimicrobiota bacterium TaxID=2528274 RepID=A0A932I1J8_UNCTE|nr:HAMP domain-containing histidine kinase [Candidatus Tectomicrobia bacterium]